MKEESNPRRGAACCAPTYRYKDSGVEWLGKVPEHWEVKRLKYCLESMTSGATPDSSNSDYWTTDGGIPFVAIADITDAEYITSTERRVTQNGMISKSLEILSKGTLLYSMYASVGKVAVLGINAVTNQAILALHIKPEVIQQKYLKSWFEFFQRYVGALASSNTQDNLNADKVRNFTLAVPPLSEQRAIASYLDRETARLDMLVSRQERLIELLQEKRRALIGQAVTRGLDETAPRKDSGVEWLGKVPEHWEVKRLKFIGDCKGGAGFPHEEQGNTTAEIPFHKVGSLGQADVKGYLQEPENRISTETAKNLGAHIFDTNSIVFAKVGAALLLNRFRLLRSPACLDNNMMGFQLTHPKGNLHYLWYSLSLIKMEEIVNPGAIPSVNEKQMKECTTPFPPIAEQRAIVEYLDAETAKIDRLIEKARRAIDLMREHRSALIASVVTGQIDVRGL